MDFTDPAPLSISDLFLNLGLGLLLSVLLAVYYSRFGDSLSNRSKFAPNLPMLTLITLLVISIVKSSLALSLGLVGALSIVRFRTAIKDPEELLFLFFAIALGLGFGADQRIPTVVAFVVIMGYLIMRKTITGAFKLSYRNNLFVNVSVPLETTTEEAYKFINSVLGEELSSADLRRLDTNEQELQLVYYVRAREADMLARISTRIQEQYAGASISIIEQNNLLGG
ncbi:MAG: DUF4956 domain-containing protein [Anaerolineales bacterium]|nr:DUF4956 domain-containing protein [Anaerolineales bacterium]